MLNKNLIIVHVLLAYIKFASCAHVCNLKLQVATLAVCCSSRSLRSCCMFNQSRVLPFLRRSLSFSTSQRNSGWGSGKVLAVRREETNIWERRAPLNPNHVQSLVREGVKVSQHYLVCHVQCRSTMYGSVHTCTCMAHFIRVHVQGNHLCM